MRLVLGRLLVPGLTTLAMLAVLIGLGTWQTERLRWKRALLADIDCAEAGPAIPLPVTQAPVTQAPAMQAPAMQAPVTQAAIAPAQFTKIQARGRLDTDRAALFGAEIRQLATGPTLGARLIVPMTRADARPLLVDLGWVPLDWRARLAGKAETVGAETTATGYVRYGETASLFSATDDTAGWHFHTLDPAAIGAALNAPSAEPFFLIVLGATPAAGWPDPAHTLPRPPNNHAAYAITWYGLAVALIVIFAVWARGSLRRTEEKDPT